MNMKRFLVNKYPIRHCDTVIPIGTIFTISAINGGVFELEPINRREDHDFPIVVDPNMLDRGFTEQDSIEV